MKMLNANTAIRKRSHAELTVPLKQEIIDYKKKFPKLTKKELIEKFKYKTVIPKSTMSDILKPDYERKLKQLDSVESYNKRVRDAKCPSLEL
jgi:hypothetical protein